MLVRKLMLVVATFVFVMIAGQTSFAQGGA